MAGKRFFCPIRLPRFRPRSHPHPHRSVKVANGL